MSRCRNIALLLSLGALGGCGENNPSGSWDAAMKTWEAAPPRQVIENPDGGSDGGTSGPPPVMGSGKFDQMCKAVNDPWCCFDGYQVMGIPICDWKAIGPGEVREVTKAYAGNRLAELPHPLKLTVVSTADRIGNGEDCNSLSVGFVLEGVGLNTTESLKSAVTYYYINKDGTWHPADGGKLVENLIVARTPGMTVTPTHTQAAETCAPNPMAKANVVLWKSVDFKMKTDPASEEVQYQLSWERLSKESGGRDGALYTTIERTY